MTYQDFSDEEIDEMILNEDTDDLTDEQILDAADRLLDKIDELRGGE